MAASQGAGRLKGPFRREIESAAEELKRK